MLDKAHKYNFYKLESEAKKGMTSFINYLNVIYESDGLPKVIECIKASGVAVSLFNSPQKKAFFKEIITYFKNKVNQNQIELITKLEYEVSCFESLFENFNNKRDQYFSQKENLDDNYKVVSYLMALELHLKYLLDNSKEFLSHKDGYQKHVALFDSALESTGMIMNYFMYKGYAFKGSKKNISPKNIQASSNHVFFSGTQETLVELLEFWSYSNVNVNTTRTGITNFKISDEEFEYSNIISNERFNNLRSSWQLNAIGVNAATQKSDEEVYDSTKESITRLFSTLYFGSPELTVKIKEIELIEWIRAYELLIKECEKFIARSEVLKTFNLEKICLVKTKFKWEKLFRANGFTPDESKILIDFFTFKRGSQDLIDAPFIEIEDKLALVPRLTSHVDVSRALASNFLNRKVNLSFKGTGFENRIINDLNESHIKNAQLYKRSKDSEYECDVAFVLGNELFFVECKAHVQPYSPRQHADHLNKLNQDTLQLNRIANFFSHNLNLVREQMNLTNDFAPTKIHQILLTTSMVGTPLFLNGVYVVDESAFITFLHRSAPSLTYQHNGTAMSIKSKKFEVYEGEIDSEKMIKFLSAPPQIQITKDFLQEKTFHTEIFQVTRKLVHHNSVRFGVDLDDSEEELMKKYFG